MNSALIIADYILAESKKPLTPMHVNKLTYISHGFTLALENEPLFKNRVEAWKYGPVIPTIYDEAKRYGMEGITGLLYCGTPFNDEEFEKRREFLRSTIPLTHQSVMNEVLQVYGGYSAYGLSAITHEKGTPWHQCYRRWKIGVEIPDSVTKAYYTRQL